MDDRAQVSLEYLVMVALAITLAAIAALLASSLFSTKDSVKRTLELYRERMF
jgi:uncharacterized protein (UPF0333 family)